MERKKNNSYNRRGQKGITMLGLLTILGVLCPVFWIIWMITLTKWALVMVIICTLALIVNFIMIFVN